MAAPALSPSRHGSSLTALSGDLVGAAEQSREELRRTFTSGEDRNPFSPTLNRRTAEAMAGKYGAFPLLSRDRADEQRREDARRAWVLKEKYGDKWPWDPVGKERPPLGAARCRKLWRKAFMFAKTINALRTKPPKQETREQLDKLLMIAIQATRKKIYYEWDLVLGAFHVDVAAEKKRQRRLRMNLKNINLEPPKGKPAKASAVMALLRSRETVRCTKVEVVKLFAHQLGPAMEEYVDEEGEQLMTEEAAGVILGYVEATGTGKVPLSKTQVRKQNSIPNTTKSRPKPRYLRRTPR
jgi:hypothetical protein